MLLLSYLFAPLIKLDRLWLFVNVEIATRMFPSNLDFFFFFEHCSYCGAVLSNRFTFIFFYLFLFVGVVLLLLFLGYRASN